MGENTTQEATQESPKPSKTRQIVAIIVGALPAAFLAFAFAVAGAAHATIWMIEKSQVHQAAMMDDLSAVMGQINGAETLPGYRAALNQLETHTNGVHSNVGIFHVIHQAYASTENFKGHLDGGIDALSQIARNALRNLNGYELYVYLRSTSEHILEDEYADYVKQVKSINATQSPEPLLKFRDGERAAIAECKRLLEAQFKPKDQFLQDTMAVFNMMISTINPVITDPGCNLREKLAPRF